MDSLRKRLVMLVTLVALVMLGSVLVAQPCDRACASACLAQYIAAVKACDGSPACLAAAREAARACIEGCGCPR